MRIGIVTPAPPKSRYGNRVTALRWARILRRLGHTVKISQAYEGEPFDLLIALHARRSSASIDRFHRRYPDLPIVVALTGTDLYRDLSTSRHARESLDIATRIVVLQPKALEDLRPSWRAKTRVIHQSVAWMNDEDLDKGMRGSFEHVRHRSTARTAQLLRSSETPSFDVCVIGHLRAVKDPFRAAMAARLLSDSSRIRVLQVGGAMTKQAETRARAETRINPRYFWLGEQPARRVWRFLKQSSLCVLSSKMEGGANAVGEAIVAGTPVLASRISGSVGILGADYAGYFEVGDTRGLARLMSRAEIDRAFYAQLQEHCDKLVGLFDPAREESAWFRLIGELFEQCRGRFVPVPRVRSVGS
jgi:glycosyltransferase involved in cell wall biosynthesis